MGKSAWSTRRRLGIEDGSAWSTRRATPADTPDPTDTSGFALQADLDAEESARIAADAALAAADAAEAAARAAAVAAEAAARAAADAAHVAAADPHTGYQKESEKGALSGYAGLDASGHVPTAQLGSGVVDATTYLRGDQSYATIPPAGQATTPTRVPAGTWYTVPADGQVVGLISPVIEAGASIATGANATFAMGRT